MVVRRSREEPAPVPTLAEFLACCDAECAFLAREHGFERLAAPPEHNRYSVRFQSGDLEVDVYGESYGQTASCDLLRGGERLPLGLLEPAAERPRRGRRGPGAGQLAQVHEIATRLKRHALDLLRGDFSRFDVRLLEPHADTLSRHQRRMLDAARERLRGEAG